MIPKCYHIYLYLCNEERGNERGKLLCMRKEKDYRKQREPCQQQDQEGDYAEPPADTHTDRGWGKTCLCLYSLSEERYG